MRTWKLVVYPAVIAVAVLFSAACGGSDKEAKPTEAPSPPQGLVETPSRLSVERLSESVVMVAPGVRSGRDFEPIATGSGTIVDESGLILTNFHVVDPDNVGAYDDIAIYVSDDSSEVPDLTYFGGLAAWDEELDLAVIRITSNRNGDDGWVDNEFPCAHIAHLLSKTNAGPRRTRPRRRLRSPSAADQKDFLSTSNCRIPGANQHLPQRLLVSP